MEFKPYSVINQLYREKLSDHTLYAKSGYSFLKIFQHALSYSLLQDNSKLIKNYLHLPPFIQHIFYFVKSVLRKPGSFNAYFKEIVVIDPVRLVKKSEDEFKSVYFDKLISCLGTERVSIIHKKKSNLLEGDFYLTDFTRNFPSPDQIEKKMLRQLIEISTGLKNSSQITEIEKQHILSALHIFFEDFRFYYHLFKGKKTKVVLFICHYHNEGLIAALKELQIQSIELQHGLIASNDLYYVYEDLFKQGVVNAFFPDKIWVYGNYWKKILANGCEFQKENIVVAGDYIWRATENDMVLNSKENVILICAQKMMFKEYVDYCRILHGFMLNHPDWRVIIKLHPLETNKPAYEALKPLGFEIIDLEIPLDTLFQRCKIQISIYSTTFFDALGFNVVNFSLQNYGNYSDYASDMVNEKIAAPLSIHEDPIALYFEKQAEGVDYLPRTEVYGEFQCESIRKSISQ